MADEVGPIQVETEALRGELPYRLTEVALTYAELTRAAVPWLSGDVNAPLAQLKDLADWSKAMEAACRAVVDEARRVHAATVARRRTAA